MQTSQLDLLTKYVDDNKMDLITNFKRDLDEQNGRLGKLCRNSNFKMQRQIDEMKKVDPLPQDRINKICEELGSQIKTQVLNMTPMRKLARKSSPSTGSEEWKSGAKKAATCQKDKE